MRADTRCSTRTRARASACAAAFALVVVPPVETAAFADAASAFWRRAASRKVSVSSSKTPREAKKARLCAERAAMRSASNRSRPASVASAVS